MTDSIKNIRKLTVSAMLIGLSVVLVYFIHFPLIPSAPFLEYDCADIPILIGSFALGPVYGIAILFCASLLQALTVSAASGWIGFLMHFIASSVLILVPSLIYRKFKTQKSMIIGMILGIIGMTAVMIPLNLIFTGLFLGQGTQTVVKLLIPAIIPFNLLKGTINSVVAFSVFIPIRKYIMK